jgi:hypothetical protein
MVNEVENVLNEIRERVRADQHRGATPESIAAPDESVKGALAAPPASLESTNDESLKRLSAHLTTTARAWDRLPPMFSNRKGGPARLELWIKARLKSMSGWFTWEQVNFNAAVHHALSETLNALSAYEQELARLRAALARENETRREEYERSNRELTALAAELRNREAKLEARSAAIEAQAAAALATEINAARAEMNETSVAIASQLAELAGELRESDEQQRQEQRVCFKQLSLEASEAAVMVDRARRVMESRLDKMEKEISRSEE